MNAQNADLKKRPDGGVPLGNGSDDEPANTLPAEPSSSTAGPGTAGSSGEGREKVRETGQTGSEEDIPSDGRDQKGEAMIRNLKP